MRISLHSTCHKTFLLLSLFFLMGCEVKQPTPLENIRQINQLTAMLIGLDTERVDRDEAKDLAQRGILYAQKLAKEYEVISPPFWQNTLVNFGIKKRGLCYEWADDLLAFFSQKRYRTLFIHKVSANIGQLNEHNALSVSLRNRSIEKSILLDAWRNSGNLFFIQIEEDKKYRWSERLY